MNCIIAGSRIIRSFRTVVKAIEESGFAPEITCVFSGASQHDVDLAKQGRKAYNVDIIGAAWAQAMQIDVRFFPARWTDFTLPGALIRTRDDGTRYVANAGPLRNGQMAAEADALILVWTGDAANSPGSADMLQKAELRGLRIFPAIVERIR